MSSVVIPSLPKHKHTTVVFSFGVVPAGCELDGPIPSTTLYGTRGEVMGHIMKIISNTLEAASRDGTRLPRVKL